MPILCRLCDKDLEGGCDHCAACNRAKDIPRNVLRMTPDERRVQYIKIALMVVALAYAVWRVESIKILIGQIGCIN